MTQEILNYVAIIMPTVTTALGIVLCIVKTTSNIKSGVKSLDRTYAKRITNSETITNETREEIKQLREQNKQLQEELKVRDEQITQLTANVSKLTDSVDKTNRLLLKTSQQETAKLRRGN